MRSSSIVDASTESSPRRRDDTEKGFSAAAIIGLLRFGVSSIGMN
jgi:hypothetical protein